MLYLLDENLNCFLRNLKCDINAADLEIVSWTLMFKGGVSSTKVRSGVYGYYLTLKKTHEKKMNKKIYLYLNYRRKKIR